MKKYIKISLPFLIFMVLFIPELLYAQRSDNTQKPIHRCGTQMVIEKEYRKNPELKKRVIAAQTRFSENIQKQKSSLSINARINSTISIPVVVHIVLNNPGTITDAQVQSQIDVLNADYGGLNADSTRIPTAFKPLFAKGRIRFCLAKQTPNGESTTGIVRVSSSIISNPGFGDPIKYAPQGSAAWDPSRYLNIWVCETTSDFIGYSFIPAIPLFDIPLIERGVVIASKYFGKGGTAQAPFNLGRTGVHEIGHFFNLVHIWGDNNCDVEGSCDDSDFVDDTPSQWECSSGSPTPSSVITDNCSPQSPGIMWMNFMDYVHDNAMVMFTPQQHARMEASLTFYDWMRGLANSNGCTPVQTLNRDVRIVQLNNASLSANSSYIYVCSNNFQPSIRVKNIGSETVNTLKIEASINGTVLSITNWSGILLPGSETDIILQSILVNTGTNPNLFINIQLVNAQADQNKLKNIHLGEGVIYPMIVTLPFNEGFELNTFPPQDWQLLNPDGDFTWERSTNVAKSGTACLYFNNFNSEVNDYEDWLISPLIPARGKDSLFLTFEVAAATYLQPSSIVERADSLQIFTSNNCGSSYDIKYNRGGIDLVTTGDISVTESFVPTADQWRKDSVFLGFFDNNAPENIQIAFKNISNWENNIYIDDIQVFSKRKNTPTGLDQITNTLSGNIKAYPNPVSYELIIEQTSGNIKNIPYRLVSIYGQEIRKGIINNQKTVIDMSKYIPGIYFLHTKYQTLKIIKK